MAISTSTRLWIIQRLLNAILFLGYLFVAIFIMLSLFLAILAEAQSKVREKEEEQKEDPTFNEYGACFSLYQGISWVWGKVSPFKKGGEEEEKEEEKEEGRRRVVSMRLCRHCVRRSIR